MTECIHGLESDVCDVCSPRQAPERPKPVRAPRPAPARPAAAEAVRTSRAPQRVYLVVARTRLAEVLDHLADEDWRSEVGSATDAIRWPDVALAERPADVVVLAADLDGGLQLVAAANEPARRAVREELDALGVDVRVVLQPAWWS